MRTLVAIKNTLLALVLVSGMGGIFYCVVGYKGLIRDTWLHRWTGIRDIPFNYRIIIIIVGVAGVLASLVWIDREMRKRDSGGFASAAFNFFLFCAFYVDLAAGIYFIGHYLLTGQHC